MPVETPTTTEQQHKSPSNNTTFTATSTSRAHDADDTADVEDEAAAAEILVPASNGFERIYDLAEKFAATRIGQFVIARSDRALRTIEDTAKWSLPQKKDEATQLERPLSWIPFLYLIVVLRCIRIGLSIAALLIGNGPVTPHDIVYFIQSRRRKLRAVRRQGLKAIVERQQAKQSSENSVASTSKGDGAGGGVIGKIRRLFASAICRPGMHRESTHRFFMPSSRIAAAAPAPQPAIGDNVASTSNAASTGSASAVQPAPKRPREDESMEEIPNQSVFEMLNSYANADSDDDSDHVPTAEELEKEDDADSSTSSEASSDAASASANETETETPNNVPAKRPDAPPSEAAASANASSGTANGNHNNSSSNNTSNNNSNNNSNNEQNDESVELGQRQPPVMPRPILEIKKEVLSSGEQSEPQTPKENGTDTWEADVAHPAAGTYGAEALRVAAADRRKSTPGHESAAMVKLMGMETRGSATTMAVPQAIKTAQPIDIIRSAQLKSRLRRKRSSSASSSSSVSSSSISLSTSSSCASPTTAPYRSPSTATPSELGARALNSHSPSITSRLRARNRSRTRARAHASSPTRSSEHNDTSSDLDSFQSLEDVHLTANSASDNLFEPTTSLSATMTPAAAAATAAAAAAAVTVSESETENVNLLHANVKRNRSPMQRTRANSQRPSSPEDDEFYSPVGSPENEANAETSYAIKTEAHSTPKDDESGEATAAATRTDEHNEKKHALHQQQQQHHQNRYRNRNRR